MANNTQFYVPRTCTEVVYDQYTEDGIQQPIGGRALSEFRGRGAYVLLGDPGAGKTACFQKEAQQPGCLYIKAREFIGFDVEDSWRDKTLFIDGLDEVRAGAIHGLVPLDAVRKQLTKLGCPSFRISCREADWLGSGDRLDLEKVAPKCVIASLYLDPLDEKGIREITQHEAPSLDVQQFLEWADRQGFIPLLGNPQILILMVKAVSGGEWPDTREQAFAIACREMVLERNRPHQQANKKKYQSTDKILNAAGMLFAHQLISGVEGYSLSPNSEDTQHPLCQRVFDVDYAELEIPLKTNLFRKGKSDEQREPIHRSVAEYLGAKYLAYLVEQNGLPIGRVLSLMTVADGGVVTPLRGLFAWFVTVCAKDRDIIMTRDPHGVVLYGDVKSFPAAQKQVLLLALYDEAEKHTGFRSENWVASPFGALATSDMEEIFRDVIESPLRDGANQALVDCILDAVKHGVAVYPSLEKPLWNLVKDHTWWPGIRGTALRIFLRDYLDDPDRNIAFLTLLDELDGGDVEDRDDNLLGILLTELYPKVLSANQVLAYFHQPKDDHLIGNYHYFWSRELVSRSSKEMIAELLDSISGREELKELLNNSHRFVDFLGELLVEGLCHWGDDISGSRLYDWLGVGLDKYGSSVLRSVDEGKPGVTVRQWITERPHRYKAILQEGAKRYGSGRKKREHVHDIYKRLFHAEAPADIDRWYLDQAAAYGTGDIAEDYFRQAVFSLQADVVSPDFTLDDIYTWVSDNPQFTNILDEMLVDKNIDSRIEHATKKGERCRVEQKRKAVWIAHIIQHKKEIEQGTAAPGIFHDLAFAYYGHLAEAKGDTPRERLKAMFPGHHDLYEAALQGLKNTKDRGDLPSVKEIIDTAAAGNTYYIAYAVLAGLDELWTQNPHDLNLATTQQYKHALAFYFTAATGNTPGWVEMLVERYPGLVSEVFVQYAFVCLKTKKEHISGIYQLAYDELWKEVAVRSAIPILEKYPARGKKEQISSLDYLIKAALRYDKDRLSVLVDKKLQFSSMDVMQRGRWLATGLLLNPEHYEKLAFEFMGNNSSRISAVAGFLTARHDQWQPDYELPETTIGMLIQKLGSYFRPYNYARSGRVTHEMNTSDLVSGFINNLSNRENTEATRELERLLNVPELKQWSDTLRGALYRQRKLARDASFQQPDIVQVRKTLSNSEPVNSADLMALILSHLHDISRRIRDGSTNDYKQYWNTDSHDKPKSPKVEEACRNALLSDLQQQLAPLKIDAVKEGYYADDNRADIRVSYNGTYGFNVPIEIKRDTHKDLWSALQDQLVKKYTRDPGAQGFGIYLVFWFGFSRIPPPSHGKRPRSAAEMKEMLWDMMTKEEKKLIGVCVMDCSVEGRRLSE